MATLFEIKNEENTGLAFSQRLLKRHVLTGKDSKINNFVWQGHPYLKLELFSLAAFGIEEYNSY